MIGHLGSGFFYSDLLEGGAYDRGKEARTVNRRVGKKAR